MRELSQRESLFSLPCVKGAFGARTFCAEFLFCLALCKACTEPRHYGEGQFTKRLDRTVKPFYAKNHYTSKNVYSSLKQTAPCKGDLLLRRYQAVASGIVFT